MRTTSVNTVIGSDENSVDDNSVIAFPRQRVIDTNASPSRQQTAKKGVSASVIRLSKDGEASKDLKSQAWQRQDVVLQEVGSDDLQASPSSHHQACDDEMRYPLVANLPPAMQSLQPLSLSSSASRPLDCDPRMEIDQADSQMFDLSGNIRTISDWTGSSPSALSRHARALSLIDQAKMDLLDDRQTPDDGTSPEALRKAAVSRLMHLHHGHDLEDSAGSGYHRQRLAASISGLPFRQAKPADYGQVSPEMEATGQYIAQMTRELAQMARNSRLDLLAYFLDMAELEAQMRLGSSSHQA